MDDDYEVSLDVRFSILTVVLPLKNVQPTDGTLDELPW